MVELFEPEARFDEWVKILEIEEQSGMGSRVSRKVSDDEDAEFFNARSTHMASKQTMAEFKLMNEGVSLTALSLDERLGRKFKVSPALAHLTDKRANASVSV
jgi:hypothetical protein